MMQNYSLDIFAEAIKIARKNNFKSVNKEILLFRHEWDILREYPDYNEIIDNKSFYDKVNILLNNFEEELNGIPQNFLKNSEIISGGIVFTPAYLAEIIVKTCMKYLQENEINLAGDVSAGMGIFIYELNKLCRRTKTISFEKNKFLYGLVSKIFDGNNRILNIDTLSETDKFNGKYDLIVGNPPYVRLQNIDSDTRSYIENDAKYKNFLFGSYDLSVTFIIKILDLLREGGIAGLILTRKMFVSAYGKKVCEYLSKNAQVLEIIDFGDNQMFQDKTTYTLVVIFRKKKDSGANTFRYCRVPAQNHIEENELTGLIEENAENYPNNMLSEYPWYFIKSSEKKILNLIMENKMNICDLFEIVQGFRTGDNKAFLVECKGKYVREYVDGKGIKKGYLSEKQNIIWPYRKVNSNYELITARELQENNPKGYAHLEKYKKKKESFREIHEYSRPQNLYAMDTMKIFVKEMMFGAEFAADEEGNICFGSGYALVPRHTLSGRELRIWAYILSTEIMEYQYRLLGTNLHSGWFRMYKEHLKKVALPAVDIHHDTTLNNIVNELETCGFERSCWDKLNLYIAGKFGLEKEDIQYILEYIQRAHKISVKKRKDKSHIKKMNKEKIEIDDMEETKYPDLSLSERIAYYPVELTDYNRLHEYNNDYRSLVTFQNDKNAPIQRWYKYTQGYSMLLVSRLLEELNVKKDEIVFDPFCGSGTTLLASMNSDISSIGCDVSPLSSWISNIKLNKWNLTNVERISEALSTLKYGCDYNYQGLQFKKFFEKAFYPEILAQTLHIRNWIDLLDLNDIEKDFLRLALISIQEKISFIRKHGSHYRFLNDVSHVGVNKLNIELINEACDISLIFKDKVNDMLNDIMMIKEENNAKSKVICSNVFTLNEKIQANVVITSPPYLNRNNYFAQQKIELSLLNLIGSPEDYHKLVKQSFCSHVEADLPEKPVSRIAEVNLIIDAVMREKSNNTKIPHMIAGYFNDMDSFFAQLPKMLAYKARIAFVVANCRWNGVVIPVDHLICRIAEQYHFEAEKIIVARMKGNSPQQMQKYGKIPVRESIVLLSYNQ